MSFMPASPMNSAYSDHSQAASTPTEMSVSIVAAPCLRLAQAALWNGQAPQSTTGVARLSDSHCQLSNCSAGTIAMNSTGIDGADELLGGDRARIELDAGLLGGVVDRRGHAVELVELALDAVRARGAGHARDRQLDLFARRAHRETSWVKAAVCTRPSVVLNWRNSRYLPALGNVAMNCRLCSSGCTCRNARSPWRSATRCPFAPR